MNDHEPDSSSYSFERSHWLFAGYKEVQVQVLLLFEEP
jgi:hypothetical protein